MAQSVLTRRTQPLAGRTGRTGRTGRIRPILLALGHMGLVLAEGALLGFAIIHLLIFFMVGGELVRATHVWGLFWTHMASAEPAARDDATIKFALAAISLGLLVSARRLQRSGLRLWAAMRGPASEGARSQEVRHG